MNRWGKPGVTPADVAAGLAEARERVRYKSQKEIEAAKKYPCKWLCGARVVKNGGACPDCEAGRNRLRNRREAA